MEKRNLRSMTPSDNFQNYKNTFINREGLSSYLGGG